MQPRKVFNMVSQILGLAATCSIAEEESKRQPIHNASCYAYKKKPLHHTSGVLLSHTATYACLVSPIKSELCNAVASWNAHPKSKRHVSWRDQALGPRGNPFQYCQDLRARLKRKSKSQPPNISGNYIRRLPKLVSTKAAGIN